MQVEYPFTKAYLTTMDDRHRADDVTDALAHLLVVLVEYHAVGDEFTVP